MQISTSESNCTPPLLRNRKQTLREYTPDGDTRIHIVSPPYDVRNHGRMLSRLARQGVPVPSVLAVDTLRREIWLEDLGPATISSVLVAPAREISTNIITAIWASISVLPHATLPSTTAVFDASTAFRRLLFAISIIARLARVDTGNGVWEEAERLCNIIGGLPNCLSHNDIHPENLVWYQGRCWLVDRVLSDRLKSSPGAA